VSERRLIDGGLLVFSRVVGPVAASAQHQSSSAVPACQHRCPWTRKPVAAACRCARRAADARRGRPPAAKDGARGPQQNTPRPRPGHPPEQHATQVPTAGG
jgi:hypothetical protein